MSRRVLLLHGRVILRWLDGKGIRRGLHLSVDTPRCAEVVAVSGGDYDRHRPVQIDHGSWGWRTKRTASLVPLGLEVGDVVIVNHMARARGTVTIDGEELSIWEAREIEAVVEGWEDGRIE